MDTKVDRQSAQDVKSVLASGAPQAQRTFLDRHRRPLLIAGGLLMALLLVWWMSGPRNSIRYVTEAAAKGSFTIIVTATGSVQPITKVDVSSELSGTIREVLVDFNSQVVVGQVLALLDTDKLKATVESSRARLAAAKARVIDAQATVREKERAYVRKRDLAQKQFSSTQDLDLAKAAYDRSIAALASTKADVAVAEAELRLNETNLAKARIVSPIKGIVLKRNVDPGQTVASSLQAPVLFTIAEDLTKMEVQVDVDEADVGKVKVGDPATFTVDAYPERKFPARIRDLRYASETVQGVVTYKAVLSVDNAELLLRPGMTATAEIRVREVKDALLVPNTALRFVLPNQSNKRSSGGLLRRILPGPPRFRPATKQDDKGVTRRLYVLRDGEPTPVSVQIGASDGRRTEIASGGLKAGDLVVVDTTTSKTN
ncbi:MAG: efflux RND transporter periplasmic adaptor subunit [Hyphomicrobiaceae bacterium]|nr:efflux RND transporter periplasmic adaptor subunit [Hyphomicrobiaceae bacterium]